MLQEQKKIDQHVTENTWYSDDKINKILGQIKQDYTVLAASHTLNDLQDRFNYIKEVKNRLHL